ncbi:TolC family protein [bacterium]|nr:MAG: TolC family protein [bacterium]
MIKKGFILLIFFAAFCSLWQIVSFADQPLGLETLISEARANNPDILAAKKRWEASKARIPQAKSLDNPTVALEFEKIPRGTFQLNNVMPEDRMLSIAQMFPLFGKLSLKGKIAVVESQMNASEYKAKELEVVNEVKNAYYDLFMNYKEIELNKESRALLEAIAKSVEAKYSVGEMSQEEVYKLHSEIARLNNRILNLEQEKSSLKTRLNALLSREAESPLGMPDLPEDVSFNKDIRALYELTLLNQPELIIFSYAIEKNKFAKSLAKRSLFPDLMSELTLRGITSGMTGSWDLMLALSVPFWFWTKQRYEIKEAVYNLEEAEAAYTAMKNKAFSETKDLYTKIEIARNKLKLSKSDLMPILEGSIGVSLTAFRSGKGDFMALLDTQRMLVENKMDYYRALVEYHMHLANLERTVGISLTEDSEVRK